MLLDNAVETSLATNIFGFQKKLEALAKQKDFELVGKWERTIINRSVASTPDGDGEIMRIKWLSLDNHIHNVHSDHHALYPECSHEPLTHETGRKKWFTRRKLNLGVVSVRSWAFSQSIYLLPWVFTSLPYFVSHSYSSFPHFLCSCLCTKIARL